VRKIDTFGALRTALSAARTDLDNTRDRIAELRARRERVNSAPVDEAEIERRIEAEMARLRDPAGGVPSNVYSFLQQRTPQRPEVSFKEMFNRDPARMLAAIVPNQIRAFMRNAATPKDASGMSDEARIAALAQIDAELVELEAREELLVRELEAGTGAPLPRRPDASPEILLAPSQELQS
jgi:hypothetical protein